MKKPENLPVRQPPGYSWLKEEPTYDPSRHLALELPEKSWNLTDFGYSPEEASQYPFPLAVTTPFRMLSDEGLIALRSVVEQLKNHNSQSERIGNFVRGGIYRSRFLRDFCNCKVIGDFIADLAGAPIVPHTMPFYQGHINLLPLEKNRDVDRWHTDTVCLDFVLLLTNPSEFEGGKFQFYTCTKERAIEALGNPQEDDPQPVSVEFPSAGYAVLQQGNMVVHRALEVTRGDERTTLVHSFMPAKLSAKDVSQLSDCKPIDPHGVLFTEWARHKAFLSQRKLAHLISHLPYTENRGLICEQLGEAIRDVQTAMLELSDESESRLVYYGQDGLTDPKV